MARRFSRLRSLVAATAMAAAVGAHPAAQDRQWAPTIEGALAPGDAHTYLVTAGAGDLITGTIEFSNVGAGGTIAVEVHDASGRKLRDAPIIEGQPAMPVAFVAPMAGTFRLSVTAKSAGRSYRLRTQRLSVADRMTASDRIEPGSRFQSPRIARLIDDVSGRNAGAVDQFWAEVEKYGSPIIEPIDGNAQQMLATVLWRATYDTRNVRVSWPYGVSDDRFMSHIAGTDVWYQTVRIVRGSRFPYALAPNFRTSDPRFGGTQQFDPLNRKSSATRGASIVEAPGAPDESWVRTVPAVRGTVTPHLFESALLKGRREISIYTPPGYAESSGPYPFVILFDGPAYARQPAPSVAGDGWEMTIGAPVAMDNLIAGRRVRPAVVVMVGYTPDGTRNDLQAPIYPDVVAKELLPWLRSRYAVSRNPRDAVIGGYSAGGAAGAVIALEYPDLFGNVLLQSAGPPGRAARMLIERPAARIRFYFDQGIYEDGIWGNATRPGEVPLAAAVQIPQTVHSRRMRDILEAKGYEVIYRETGGDHDDNHWRGTIAEALTALLGSPAI